VVIRKHDFCQYRADNPALDPEGDLERIVKEALVELLFSNTIANTTIHAIKIAILFRSQTPIHGVGPLVEIFGASRLVRIPNTRYVTNEMIVYNRNFLLIAAAPNPIMSIISKTVTTAQTICKVSVRLGSFPRRVHRRPIKVHDAIDKTSQQPQ
jgi:hypothetical protein